MSSISSLFEEQKALKDKLHEVNLLLAKKTSSELIDPFCERFKCSFKISTSDGDFNDIYLRFISGNNFINLEWYTFEFAQPRFEKLGIKFPFKGKKIVDYEVFIEQVYPIAKELHGYFNQYY